MAFSSQEIADELQEVTAHRDFGGAPGDYWRYQCEFVNRKRIYNAAFFREWIKDPVNRARRLSKLREWSRRPEVMATRREDQIRRRRAMGVRSMDEVKATAELLKGHRMEAAEARKLRFLKEKAKKHAGNEYPGSNGLEPEVIRDWTKGSTATLEDLKRYIHATVCP